MQVEQPREVGISVVIPAFQAAATIERAIMSAAHQTCRPKEIIVCDDGSQDGTAAVVEALGSSVNGVPLRFMTQPNRGAGAARNKAIEEATSEWIAFLDADDEWLPGKLEHSVSEINKSDLTLVAHNYVQVGADKNEQLVDCTRRFLSAENPLSALYRYGFIATSTVVVRKQAVRNAGGFDETLATAQDFDLWLKVLSEGGARFVITDAPLMRYTLSATGITSHTMRRLDCTLRVAQRHQRSYPNLIVRLMAIHYEAVTVYWRAQNYLRAFWILVLLVARLVGSPLMINQSNRETNGVPNWLVWFFWLWVIGLFGAYLYRFNHLIVAFYKLVLSL